MIASSPPSATQPIALLADRYGLYLENLSRPQILFVVSVLSEHLRLDCPLEEVFDLLDPDALIPQHLTQTLSKLEHVSRRKLIELLLYCNMAMLSESL